MAVHAEGNYVLLLRANAGSYLLRVSISSIAKMLRLYRFLRIHGSVPVNASFVEEPSRCLRASTHFGSGVARNTHVTRTYKSNLKHLALCWIGFDGFVE